MIIRITDTRLASGPLPSSTQTIKQTIKIGAPLPNLRPAVTTASQIRPFGAKEKAINQVQRSTPAAGDPRPSTGHHLCYTGSIGRASGAIRPNDVCDAPRHTAARLSVFPLSAISAWPSARMHRPNERMR